MLMRLSVARIIKGETPSAMILPITGQSGFKASFLIVREDLLLTRKPTVQSALSSWEITVALAAPFTPM